MDEKILKRAKIGAVVLMILIISASVSISTVVITDTEMRFYNEPLQTVRYNETTQSLEIIENLTVYHLTVNGNHVVNGNNIINGNNSVNGNTSLCNTSQNCFGGNCTFGNETSYVNINQTGIITLHGEARVEKEVKFDMTRVKKGISQPDEDVIQIGNGGSSVYAYVLSFDPGKTNEILFVWHTSFDMDPSEGIEFHMVWKPEKTWVGGSYNWSLDYIIKHDDGANNTGDPTTIWSIATPASADNFIETRFSTKITGATNDDMIFARFYLSDEETTAIAEGHVIFVELKYCVNKLGERGFT